MAHGYQSYSPEQGYLLAPNPLEWLPDDHLAYQVRDLIAEFDLARIYSAYSQDGRGAPAFAPQMMLAVLLYAQYKGVLSCRQIMQLCIEDLGARFLTAGTVPDYRSINKFRLLHKDALRDLFQQSVRLCESAGMVSLSRTAIDGTKVPGAGSKDRSRTYEHIAEQEAKLSAEEAKLSAEMEALVQAGLDKDAEEDARLGKDNDGYSLPENLRSREGRRAALRQAKAELEQRAREKEQARKEEWDKSEPADRPHKKTPDPDHAVPDPTSRYNFTDPESRMMKRRGQYVQGYNAQLSVDADHQVIVACAVTNEATDYGQLVPLAEQTAQNMGRLPGRVLADCGYFDHKNIEELERKGFTLLVPPNKKWQRDQAASAPLQAASAPLQAASAPLQAASAPLTEVSHQVMTTKERMQHQMMTEEGRAEYAYRMKTVEPVFGQIKGSPGHEQFTRFLRRGLERVQEDWCLVCLIHNVKKLLRYRTKQKQYVRVEKSNASHRRAAAKMVAQMISLSL
jgi:transposase